LGRDAPSMALVNHSAQLVVKDVEALLANREQRYGYAGDRNRCRRIVSRNKGVA
jgi:hypothetical protein